MKTEFNFCMCLHFISLYKRNKYERQVYYLSQTHIVRRITIKSIHISSVSYFKNHAACAAVYKSKSDATNIYNNCNKF